MSDERTKIAGDLTGAESDARYFSTHIRFAARVGWQWEAKILDHVIEMGTIPSGCDHGEPESCNTCGEKFELACKRAAQAFLTVLNSPESTWKGPPA